MVAGGTMELTELEPKLLSDLHQVASELGIKNFRKYSKQDLINRILNEQSGDKGLQVRTGLLDILPDGFGFLRTQGYTQSDSDIYVSLSQIRRFKLRRGDEITGPVSYTHLRAHETDSYLVCRLL